MRKARRWVGGGREMIFGDGEPAMISCVPGITGKTSDDYE